MIATKKEIGENVWMIQFVSGENIKVVCRKGQTPEDVLEEADAENCQNPSSTI